MTTKTYKGHKTIEFYKNDSDKPALKFSTKTNFFKADNLYTYMDPIHSMDTIYNPEYGMNHPFWVECSLTSKEEISNLLHNFDALNGKARFDSGVIVLESEIINIHFDIRNPYIVITDLSFEEKYTSDFEIKGKVRKIATTKVA